MARINSSIIRGASLGTILALLTITGAGNALAQQIVTVDPGDAWLSASDDYSEQVTWRVASKGGAASPRGVFVNLDNNQELAVVDQILEFSGDRGVLTEVVQISATQARSWHAKGVRRVGYRRVFAGVAGSLSNHILFDLNASGRLAQVEVSPSVQTVSGQSRKLMMAWNLGSDLGAVRAYSVSGQFIAGDRVIYEVAQSLTAQAGETRKETVELPPGLVHELLAQGIDQVRYTRTFVDNKDTRRSASVDIRLTR
ncbi:hypothetical protein PVT68_13230 [Microbulbifer bruguierae]|uniref:Uncharacterized protein n=1 Tax=Microbulbifer bruguierae TaxID=3029061 RepID=A0ABY8N9Z7_9GAMM|nr:hypothetical protein [Microbulbifer bruguierae]WGL15728.1 hypothetical protein PVT68_13230 [Microbulbifer bruguierae]